MNTSTSSGFEFSEKGMSKPQVENRMIGVLGEDIAHLIAGTSICSFCGRDEREYDVLVRGPRVQICDICIELCREEVALQRSERLEQ